MRKILFIFVLALLLPVVSSAQTTSSPGAAAPSVSSRVTFEYATVTSYNSNSKKNKPWKQLSYSGGGAEDVTTLTESECLSQLGAQGWELVSVTRSQADAMHNYFWELTTLYFKRVKR